MPKALLVKPMIEFLVSSPDALRAFLWLFTIIEAIVGFFVIIGLFTRLMGVGLLILATGILLGAGWLGTTCLDEWQIGILGMASGIVIMFTGSGPNSIDSIFIHKNTKLSKRSFFPYIASGPIEIGSTVSLKKSIFVISIISIFLTLMTNQIFHGGVWGKLHNLSVKPHLLIENAKIDNKGLRFSIYRDEGADVYGSFVIAIRLLDQDGKQIKRFNDKDLSSIPKSHINNYYIAKIIAGKNSLIIPLGAKADLRLEFAHHLTSGTYSLEVEDISGLKWTTNLNI